jgi:tetratricopeptide (TPR) repeat protein
MKTVLELEDLAAKAIKAALAQNWADAAALNQQILEEDPENIEAYNRLAKSFSEQGETAKAKETYEAVLALDPYNSIAQKNLAKLGQGGSPSSRMVSNELFLEEPGKTRSAILVEPQKKRLAGLTSGEKLALEPRHGRLAVVTTHNGLLGYLEDTLSSHLLNLLQLGNTYSVHLLANTDVAQVFLREISQSAQAAKYVSFNRTHSSPLALSSVREHLNNEALSASLDEDLDSWEESDAESDTSDDDYVSLEAMRDEEEESNNGFGGRDY